mgnify:CR=1 FL=1
MKEVSTTTILIPESTIGRDNASGVPSSRKGTGLARIASMSISNAKTVLTLVIGRVALHDANLLIRSNLKVTVQEE